MVKAMITVDPTELYMWLGIFFAGGIMFTFIILFLISPKQIWAFIKAKALRRVLINVCSDSGSVNFKACKVGPEGQVKITKNNIKVIPRSGNPIISNRSFLQGTGIPYFETYDGGTVAVSPLTLAAMETVSTPKKERKNWAKKYGFEIEKESKDQAQPTKKTKFETLFTMDARKLIDFFKGKPSRDQYEAELEAREWIGKKSAGKPIIAAGIAGTMIISALILGAILLLPLLS